MSNKKDAKGVATESRTVRVLADRKDSVFAPRREKKEFLKKRPQKKGFSPWWAFFALGLLLSGLLGVAALDVETHYEMEDFFPEETPERRAYDAYRERFGRDDRSALMLIESSSRLNLQTLQEIAALTKRLEKHPDVEKVRTPANALIPILDPNGVVKLKPAFPAKFLNSKAQNSKAQDSKAQDSKAQDSKADSKAQNSKTHSKIHSKAHSKALQRLEYALERFASPPYVNQVLSKDARVAVVTITLREDALSTQSRRAFTRALETEAQTLRERGYEVQLAGYPVHRVYMSDHIAEESRRLLPIVLLIVALALGVIFRGFAGVVIPMIVASTSLLWCLGVMSLLGLSMNILAPALFILVALVSITDAVHFVATYQDLLGQGVPREDAPRAVLQKLFVPCLLTSLTTSLVFAGLGLVGIPLIADLGLGVAAGVLAAFAATVLFVPPIFALMGRLPERAARRQRSKGRLSRALLRLDARIARQPQRALLLSALLIIGALAAIPQIQLNSPLLADLSPDHPIQATNRFMAERLGGVIPLDVIIERPEGATLSETYAPERMQRIDDLTAALRAHPAILSATSPIDNLRQLQPLLQNVSEEETASLMPTALLLSSKQMRPWLHEKTHTLRIQTRLRNVDTIEALALFEDLRALHAKHLKEPPTEGLLNGQGYLGQVINAQLVEHFEYSLLLGVLLVVLAVGFALSSAKLALVALLPNLFPLLMVAGVMGLTGIELRYTSALALSIVFGLAVDDTIHVLAQLKAHRAAPDPIQSATRSAGVGIVWSSVVLMLGFGALMISVFIPNQVLGLMLCLTAIAALWGDLILLPALLRKVSTWHIWGGRVIPLCVKASRLSPETLTALRALTSEKIQTEFSSKQQVILLRDGSWGPILGFVVWRLEALDLDGERIQVLRCESRHLPSGVEGLGEAARRGRNQLLRRTLRRTLGGMLWRGRREGVGWREGVDGEVHRASWWKSGRGHDNTAD